MSVNDLSIIAMLVINSVFIICLTIVLILKGIQSGDFGINNIKDSVIFLTVLAVAINVILVLFAAGVLY